MERTLREQNSTLEVRPIFHHRDDSSIGHIVAGFLALRLEVDLQQRLDERQVEVSWPDLMRDLGQVQSVLLELDGNRYQLRTDYGGRGTSRLRGRRRAPAFPGYLSGTIIVIDSSAIL